MYSCTAYFKEFLELHNPSSRLPFLPFIALPLPSLPLVVGHLNPARGSGGAPAEIEFGAFLALSLTSGDKNFSDSPENQPNKFHAL